MHREGTAAQLAEGLIAETLDWLEDVAAIRALQTATRRPDLVRELIAGHVQPAQPGGIESSDGVKVARRAFRESGELRPDAGV